MKAGKIVPGALLLLILGPATVKLLPRKEPPPEVGEVRTVVAPTPPEPATPTEWFRRLRPLCTPTDVRLATDLSPPPPGPEGTGYRAACFVLADQVSTARAHVLGLPEAEQRTAVHVLDRVAQEVAGAGDGASAAQLRALASELVPPAPAPLQDHTRPSDSP